MFELIKNGKNDYYNICINGITYLRSQVHFYGDEPEKHLHYVIKDKEVRDSIFELKINDFGDFSCISIYDFFDFNYESENYLSIFTNDNIGNIEVAFEFTLDTFNWKNKYSFVEYFDQIKQATEQSNLLNGRLNKFTDEGPTFNFIFTLPRFSESLNDFLMPYINEFKFIHEKSVLKLQLSYVDDSLIAQFNFPEELKNYCEQYLLYFAQFLKDLGINATSDLKEEAGKVLFSVTPTDDNDALGKIREALAVYLNLPASPIVYDDSFAAMRLQQQIENLQHSQRMAVRELQFNEKLLIAQSDTIHEKNIMISHQQSVIEQQNKIIEKITDPAIMMNSVENKEELEKFCEGFEVGKSEFLMKQIGVHLNPATVLKTIGKKILGKHDEKKSVLGLDEE